MQSRLQRLVHDRLQMTAAISHDLRTPITRLRLRAEFVEDDEQRRKLLADLAHMEALIDSTLAFRPRRRAAGSHQQASTSCRSSTTSATTAPASRSKRPQGLESRLPFMCRPVALRRCVGNLVDNAVKYGTAARVSLDSTPAMIFIRVDDDGPGIPDSEQARMFEPYERLDASRNSRPVAPASDSRSRGRLRGLTAATSVCAITPCAASRPSWNCRADVEGRRRHPARRGSRRHRRPHLQDAALATGPAAHVQRQPAVACPGTDQGRQVENDPAIAMPAIRMQFVVVPVQAGDAAEIDHGRSMRRPRVQAVSLGTGPAIIRGRGFGGCSAVAVDEPARRRRGPQQQHQR